MRRRDFISLLGAAAVLCSTRSRAQQPSKTYLIGVLATAQIPSLIKALKDGLRKLDYIEGQNLKFEYRFLPTGGASAETLAAELVKLGPDIIITVGTLMTITAKRATTTIPIVMAPVADPLATGIVTNLAHPGGNVTGTMLYGFQLAGKRVDVFKAAVPAIARIAVLGTGRVEPIAMAGDAVCGRVAWAGGAPVHGAGPREAFCHFRCHRARQRQWFARLGRPSVQQLAAKDHRACSEVSPASHL